MSLIDQLREQRLRTYEVNKGDIREHYEQEQSVLAGGYAYRQVSELVQNGADAILEANERGADQDAPPRIEILLRGTHLYAANTGAPFSEAGIDALLRLHSSPKRGIQIGRFGLGFKSLLRFGGRIEITSSQEAFFFDPERCREELRRRFNVEDAPGLRLAWPLENGRAAELKARFPWATTIVCAEVNTANLISHLQEEIDRFPAEFLLFLPVPLSLSLDSGRSVEVRRELRRDAVKHVVTVHDGGSITRWRIVQIPRVRIRDARAVEDAGTVHARGSVPLIWAVPLEGKREEAGRFWAFFPTLTLTYLPGILNAPWKLNGDRTSIIPGDWNNALMEKAAKLVSRTLSFLRTAEDPGRVLDMFPRQLGHVNEIAAPLNRELWALLESVLVIPDANSTLRHATELWRHPRDNAELARSWQALANVEQRDQLVHPSCLEIPRDSRLNTLAEHLGPGPGGPSLCRMDARRWFEAIASNDKEKTIKVLKLAEAYAKDCLAEWSGIRPTLAIIPTADGSLLTAQHTVFAPEGAHVPAGRYPVAQWLCEDTEAKRILSTVLRVKPLDDGEWLNVLREALSRIPGHPPAQSDHGWRMFWTLLRAAPPAAGRQFAESHRPQIRVRRCDGKWVKADAALLPGSLVNADDANNKGVLVDVEVHATDEDLLIALGVCEIPEGTVSADDQTSGLEDWLEHWRSHYHDHVNNHATWNLLRPSGLTMPTGWRLLTKLTGIPNARLTAKFVAALGEGQFSAKIRFGHARVAHYPAIEVPHPLLWLLLRHGTYDVEGQLIRLAAITERLEQPAMTRLPDWQELLPALERLKDAIPKATVSSEEIRAMWQVLIKTLATPVEIEGDSLGDLWSGAARDKVAPESLPTADGDVLLQEVHVTGSPDLARRARAQGHMAITLDTDTLSLWLEKGASDLSALMKPDKGEVTGPAELLVATMPEWSKVLRPEVRETARCQTVAGLKLMVADTGTAVPCLMWEDTLYLDAEQLALLPRNERYRLLIAETAAAGWLQQDTRQILRLLFDSELEARRTHVAAGSSPAERLLRAVGNRMQPLRLALGDVGGLAFLDNVTELELASLVLAQLGPATLTTLREELEKEGLKPPSRWNTADARAFVASLGFPDEFAASAEARREPEEFISGPIELPPLHNFQNDVFEGIRTLIHSGTGRRRAVVSLPTGGGKTRVTVQAAVLLVLQPEGERRSVIWVAQTDELCEQAVQAFRQVWLNLGAQGTDLRIVRFWGGNPNPAIQDPDKPVVIIASIQTLNSRMSAEGLAWLQTPGLVVVDECHHAITKSYTSLLRWLKDENKTPILGLSATPFRVDDEASRRLASRFDRQLLPSNQAELHRRLREQGVLAEVVNEPLESGVVLPEDKVARLLQFLEQGEGVDFERCLDELNQLLASNPQRNELLVELISQAPERSILLFANSVLHAEEMSARLNLRGIPAAAVSSETSRSARRYFLERFLHGDVRVLCNYLVLSTGFDAPKTDMVLISRAVFSPVRYMQMVGRGLRGVENGGTARCRIVTVLDNLGRFQDQHPYKLCQKYFNPGQ